MRTMVLTSYGAPLERAEAPEPEPLSPGHALLEVLTCGVCFSDVKIARGRMPFSGSLHLPHVPGHEICARVLATEPAGALPEGQVVVVYNVWPCGVCDRCRAGQENICRNPVARAGFTDPGGLRERMVAPLDRLLPVPDSIDPVSAAPLTCALGTAYRAAITRGGIVAGTRAAVIGLGGVGIHAQQVAVAAGGIVAGLDRSPDALAAARGLGLSAYDASAEDLAERLLADGVGDLDVVLDTVGAPATIEQAARLLRPGGRLVLVGYAVGRDFAFPSARLVLEEIEVFGSRYALRAELERAIRLVAEGRVRMVVDRTLPFERADEAFRSLEAGQVVGRLVLTVAPAGAAANGGGE